MLSTFGLVSPYFKFKYGDISIDNIAFQLHYKWSFAVLIVCTILVTSRQYIGEHIRCTTGDTKLDPVINTFCFFTTTFTLARHLNESVFEAGAIPHPGVGPFLPSDEKKHHAYYQWVPFVLFLQAILFYVPHQIWKKLEGGKINALASGLKMVTISQYLDKGVKLNSCNMEFPSKDATDISALQIKTTFVNRLKINRNWGRDLLFCEFLNLLNILMQIYFVNYFLGGQFLSFGVHVIKEDWGSIDIFDVVFPKVTKCTFHKFGPSGTLQTHDALCVMALNIINEKIYTFLWFWFAFLVLVSLLALVWRFVTIILYKRSATFNANIFSYASPGRLNRNDVEIVTRKCSYSNWLFLYCLASNLDPYVFRQVLSHLAEQFAEYDQEASDNEANQQSEKHVYKDPQFPHTSSIDTVDGERLLDEKIKRG